MAQNFQKMPVRWVRLNLETQHNISCKKSQTECGISLRQSHLWLQLQQRKTFATGTKIRPNAEKVSLHTSVTTYNLAATFVTNLHFVNLYFFCIGGMETPPPPRASLLYAVKHVVLTHGGTFHLSYPPPMWNEMQTSMRRCAPAQTMRCGRSLKKRALFFAKAAQN